QNHPPDSDAKDRSIADTTPPRRPTARDAVRPPRVREEPSDGNTGKPTTADEPSEPRPTAKRDFDRVTGEHKRSSTPQQPSASSHDQLGQDKRPTRPPGIRALPSGRSLDAPTLQPSVPPLAAPEPSAGETMSPLSPGGRRL